MSAVLAALANEDVEYTGIVRPLRDGTYDRNDRYLPPLERLASGSAGPSRDYGPLTTHGWEENYRSVQPPDVRRGSGESDSKPRHFESSNGGSAKDAGPSRDNGRKNGNETKDAARPAPASPEATQKKKKRKVNPAKPMEHIPEGAEVEYEQDGDPMVQSLCIRRRTPFKRVSAVTASSASVTARDHDAARARRRMCLACSS